MARGSVCTLVICPNEQPIRWTTSSLLLCRRLFFVATPGGGAAGGVGPAGPAVTGPAKAHGRSGRDFPVLCELPPARRFVDQATTIQKRLSVAEGQLISNGGTGLI